MPFRITKNHIVNTDIAQTLDIECVRANTFYLRIEVSSLELPEIPFDFSNFEAFLQVKRAIYNAESEPAVIEFSSDTGTISFVAGTSEDDPSYIILQRQATAMTVPAGDYHYDFTIIDQNGTVVRWFKGKFKINQNITDIADYKALMGGEEPLPPVTENWDNKVKEQTAE